MTILIPDGKGILFHRTASLIATHSLCKSALGKKKLYSGCTSDLRHYYSTPMASPHEVTFYACG